MTNLSNQARLLKSLTFGTAALSVVTTWAMTASPVQAQCAGSLCTLGDLNSIVQIDTSSQQGLLSWEVDSVNQMAQEWFWYRVGDTNPEASIDTLQLLSLQTADTNPGVDNRDDRLTALWRGSDFDLAVEWLLTGGAPDSGKSEIAEQVSITNQSAGNLTFYLFEYTDFDLQGSPNNDFYTLESINTFKQFDEDTAASITYLSPAAEEVRYELAPFPNLLNSLNDGLPTILANTPPIGQLVGPGDEAFAWQWKLVIAPNQTVTISKNKQVQSVPEPVSSLALLSFGLLGLALKGRASSPAFNLSREDRRKIYKGDYLWQKKRN